MRTRWWWSALAASALACSEAEEGDLGPRDVGVGLDAGSDSGVRPDAGQDGGLPGDTGPAPDSGPVPDGGPNDETPLTERTPRNDYACAVIRDRTDHTPRYWSYGGHDLQVSSGGIAYSVRVESMPPNPFEQAPANFIATTLAADGTFGSNIILATNPPDEILWPSAAPRGDGVAVVYVDGTRLRFVAFDGAGQVVIAAKDLPGITVDFQTRPKLVAFGGGFGLVYQRPGAGNVEVLFLALDGDGNPSGSSRPVTTTPEGYDPALVLVGVADGFGLLFRDQVNQRFQVFFTKLSPTGEVVVPRRRISLHEEEQVEAAVGSGFDSPGITLLAHGTGYLAAWNESRRGEGLGGDASSVVKVVRLDGSGVPLGVAVPARSHQVDVDEVEPALVPFGNAVALMWGRGTHIYICAGCTPDHRIDMLLLDPEDLTPVSNLVTIEAPPGIRGGGLLRREAAVLGNSLLVVYGLTFHVHSTPGSAAFGCD
jgi:hypothetical protein